jgi:hypothetical protein
VAAISKGCGNGLELGEGESIDHGVYRCVVNLGGPGATTIARWSRADAGSTRTAGPSRRGNASFTRTNWGPAPWPRPGSGSTWATMLAAC